MEFIYMHVQRKQRCILKWAQRGTKNSAVRCVWEGQGHPQMDKNRAISRWRRDEENIRMKGKLQGKKEEEPC